VRVARKSNASLLKSHVAEPVGRIAFVRRGGSKVSEFSEGKRKDGGKTSATLPEHPFRNKEAHLGGEEGTPFVPRQV